MTGLVSSVEVYDISIVQNCVIFLSLVSQGVGCGPEVIDVHFDVLWCHTQSLEKWTSRSLVIAITNVVFLFSAGRVRACRSNDCHFRTIRPIPILIAVRPDWLSHHLDQFFVGEVVVVEEDAAEEKDLDRRDCDKKESKDEIEFHH